MPRRTLLCVLLAALAACNPAGDTATPAVTEVTAPPAPDARYLTITPAKARIDRGELLRLEVTAFDAARRVLPRAAITWSSADNTLATVADGVVRAQSAGYVAIFASSGAASAYSLLQIGVAGEYPTGVVITPALATLTTCAPAFFQARTDPDIGDTRFRWETSDSSTLRIAAAGELRGIAAGSADVTVTWLPDPSRRAVRTFQITSC